MRRRGGEGEVDEERKIGKNSKYTEICTLDAVLLFHLTYLLNKKVYNYTSWSTAD
jgi:hypothetical protein